MQMKLDSHLLVQTRPMAKSENIVYWKNYRVTVLGSRLIRVERSQNKKFRDGATQSVWFRDMDVQAFTFLDSGDSATITTCDCALLLKEKRKDCRVILNGKTLPLSNVGNLKGTYRTLDGCDGAFNVDMQKNITLGMGVCSKTGVAVLDDSRSLTLLDGGQVCDERANGSDEYLFAFGNDYRGAVRALYAITGNTPLVPRFALGNWWSRYYVYTHEEYMRLLQRFEDNEVPLTVATIDMDWHYSMHVDEEKQISAQGKNTEYYGCANCVSDILGWTGYSWNKNLFPDYKEFLKEIKEKNLKITLNLHPADGVRWFEDQYEEMAKAMDIDPKSEAHIAFDIADPKFINAYFSVLHKPYEVDGVDFWWIDWQQGPKTKVAGLDPLWALNHYHYLDNAKNHLSPVILSRYAGVGSHRYPLGFSGDTFITWKTLAYFPYFTTTATNVGYTWWSHDIGGHHFGEKDDEMFVRHLQFGVFSPINRLHCTATAVICKEPWLCGNGMGQVAMEWLRLRHRLIPYLYSASYQTHAHGNALIEPLYYTWDEPNAYAYKDEYLFGGQLLVIPILSKQKSDGYARVKAWIPEGEWTDIFTGDTYVCGKGGAEKTLLRKSDSIPVLARSGGVLPLSLDKGNSVQNPEKLEISVWNGNGAFTLFEDGKEQGNSQEFFTDFSTAFTKTTGAGMQSLKISSRGEASVIPKNRVLDILFKNIKSGEITLKKNGEIVKMAKKYGDCARLELAFEPYAEYEICVQPQEISEQEKRTQRAFDVLLRGEGTNIVKNNLYIAITKTKTVEEYIQAVDSETRLSKGLRERLKETL